jgi:bacteriorhodopsin
MNEVFTLSYGQYELVLNALNLSVAVLGGFALLFMLIRSQVSPAYRTSMALMAAVVAMAAYHYFRIYQNWDAAFLFKSGQYVPSGLPFNYAYRYADWLGTVPLLLSAVVLVLDLGRQKSASLVTRMVISAVLMIGLGYFGEIERSNMTLRAIWGGVATLPMLYVIYVLWSELSSVLAFESERVQSLFRNLRLVLIGTWCFYPIVFMFPVLGLSGATVETAVQVGNSVADILAKAGLGLLIFAIAREKSEEDFSFEDGALEQDANMVAAD